MNGDIADHLRDGVDALGPNEGGWVLGPFPDRLGQRGLAAEHDPGGNVRRSIALTVERVGRVEQRLGVVLVTVVGYHRSSTRS